MAVRVIEICKLSPQPEWPTESFLQLTFFDTLWYKFHPVERIFFYRLTTDSASFFSSILPALKHSLSLTLRHFLPFSGNLVWPPDSDKPLILYTPGDGVSLTVAESDADFDRVSGDSAREIPDSHHYLPELEATESKAATMSFQVTVFPGKGFSIGISSHHAVFDGKSITLFLKSWAYICKHTGKANDSLTLPPELTPFLDRTVIQDPEGLDMVYLNYWTSLALKSGVDANPRSLKLFTWFRSTTDVNFVRGTFKLSSEDIDKIRTKALSFRQGKNEVDVKHYSTFVLTYAYVAIAIVKAKRLEKKKLVLIIAADCRGRLGPLVDANYCGNCVSGIFHRTDVELVIKEDGLAFLVEELTKAIKSLEKGPLNSVKGKTDAFKKMEDASTEKIGVAGSPRFGVYGIDFGWGKPSKVEVTSIDRGTSISMAESRDGNGGVEVGIVLKKDEMKLFDSFFADGLREPYM